MFLFYPPLNTFYFYLIFPKQIRFLPQQKKTKNLLFVSNTYVPYVHYVNTPPHTHIYRKINLMPTLKIQI